MESVREASIEWVSLKLQEARPREPSPRKRAEQLVTVAEEFEIPVEDLRKWIEQQPPYRPVTAEEFGFWAKGYDAVRAMERREEQRRK